MLSPGFAYSFSREHSSSLFVLPSVAAGSLVLINILFDLSTTYLRESAFYFSESLLFSSFWVLFILLIPALLYVQKSRLSFWVRLGLAAMACVTHFVLYPGLVWILSKSFYEHTFEFRQTLEFSLNTYCFVTLIVYALVGMVGTWVENKDRTTAAPVFLQTIVVAEHGERRLIPVGQILYFSSNPPYVNLCVEGRKHLYKGTLRALERQLNPEQFIRIHKSCIVNLQYVVSLRSRQNGDYDVALTDGTSLRSSRVYAPELKRHTSNAARVAAQ